MERLLIALGNCEAFVMQASGDNVENMLGGTFEDWPEDLGIYDHNPGLWIWEGEIDENNASFKGEIRDLTDQEWELLHNHRGLWT